MYRCPMGDSAAIEIQRTVKAKFHPLVNEIDLLIPVPEQVQKLIQQHAFAVHTHRGGSQFQEDLELIVGQ